ncbi:DUF3164 family protein [Ornithobacterium rhinotracheale]|uniref:DUF3164 family protein n=1 Tax=Ornithobacterium rhinotracheale TaxID=28251 RepID=UPI00129CB7EC|nr:DUF3164 family protein [Ornithobacterium rhinotracheale]MRI64406.1 DUF3164 family protein [Ornithobacterium rhinotracheale]
MNLANLTDEQLAAELKRREQEKLGERKAYKDLVNQNILPIVKDLRGLSDMMAKTKLQVFSSLKILLETKNEVFGVRDTQQSHTFSDEKGNTISYGFRVIDGWDDTVTAGIEKVREFIASLAKDEATGKLVHAVNQLLKKDAKGNLKASRVLELTKLAEEFNDDNFTDAVNIIRQAYKPQRSAFFVDASYTDAQGKKVNIPLTISAVDFPEGTNVDELFPVNEKFLAN